MMLFWLSCKCRWLQIKKIFDCHQILKGVSVSVSFKSVKIITFCFIHSVNLYACNSFHTLTLNQAFFKNVSAM